MTESTLESLDPQVEIQWSVYAEHYDAMCSVNPSYESMLTLVLDKVLQLKLPDNARILDVGAGTGNLLLRIARELPDSEIVHLDMDNGMNRWAKKKYDETGISNISIAETQFLSWLPGDQKFDLILSTNALYAIHPHEDALAKLNSLLKKEGNMVLVDFGRKQNTNDWLWYIAKSSIKSNGIKSTAKIFKENWEAARQNRRTTAAQENGYYWLHNTQEFASELIGAGFEVYELERCYRGYSDLAVCKKMKE
ncbi:MAG: class I SAM-dependent methyltransferase [Pseudomonadales bacterium]